MNVDGKTIAWLRGSNIPGAGGMGSQVLRNVSGLA